MKWNVFAFALIFFAIYIMVQETNADFTKAYQFSYTYPTYEPTRTTTTTPAVTKDLPKDKNQGI